MTSRSQLSPTKVVHLQDRQHRVKNSLIPKLLWRGLIFRGRWTQPKPPWRSHSLRGVVCQEVRVETFSCQPKRSYLSCISPQCVWSDGFGLSNRLGGWFCHGVLYSLYLYVRESPNKESKLLPIKIKGDLPLDLVAGWTAEDSLAVSAISQEYTYMIACKRKFRILSSYEKTFFLSVGEGLFLCCPKKKKIS